MYHVNEHLTVERNENGAVSLNVALNRTIGIVIQLSAEEWRMINQEVPAEEGTSMFDEARKAHEKYVQLPIEHQFQIGINVGVITDDEAKKGDSLKLHNAFLKMIYGGEPQIAKLDEFMKEVESSWEQLNGKQG